MHSLIHIPCITGSMVGLLILILIFLAEIANPTFHRYSTRSNRRHQMEQIQVDLKGMRTQVDTRVAQFIEVITNLALGQEELRALVKIPRVVQNENEHPEFMFEYISMGKPCPNATVNLPNQHGNDYQNVTHN